MGKCGDVLGQGYGADSGDQNEDDLEKDNRMSSCNGSGEIGGKLIQGFK